MSVKPNTLSYIASHYPAGVCTVCNHDTYYDDFIWNSSICRKCKAILNKEYRERNAQRGVTVASQVCSTCTETKTASQFAVSTGNPTGLQYICKKCHALNSTSKHSTKYIDSLKQATPAWLTKEMIEVVESFYTIARALTSITGVKYEVDHIKALSNKDSSGLNVPWNLQVITKSENASKGNRDV